MSAVDITAKVWQVILAVAGVAVLIAQLILNSGDPGGVRQFAIYLVAQTWVEALVVGLLSLVAFVVWKQHRLVDDLRRLRPRPLAILSAVGIVALAVSLTWPLYYVARARYYFWTHLTRKAYVESYRAEIHDLLQQGRGSEALSIATSVSAAFKDTPESGYLDTAVTRLQIINERSRRLSDGAPDATGWNPVTQRRAYFQIAEAVRVNPQNYRAADILKAMVEKAERGLKLDEAAICTSRGNLMNFQGHSTALVEAEARWAAAGSVEACPSVFRGKAGQAWRFERARCLIAVSDQTRMPAAASAGGAELLASLPACEAYAEQSFLDDDLLP